MERVYIAPLRIKIGRQLVGRATVNGVTQCVRHGTDCGVVGCCCRGIPHHSRRLSNRTIRVQRDLDIDDELRRSRGCHRRAPTGFDLAPEKRDQIRGRFSRRSGARQQAVRNFRIRRSTGRWGGHARRFLHGLRRNVWLIGILPRRGLACVNRRGSRGCGRIRQFGGWRLRIDFNLRQRRDIRVQILRRGRCNNSHGLEARGGFGGGCNICFIGHGHKIDRHKRGRLLIDLRPRIPSQHHKQNDDQMERDRSHPSRRRKHIALERRFRDPISGLTAPVVDRSKSLDSTLSRGRFKELGCRVIKLRERQPGSRGRDAPRPPSRKAVIERQRPVEPFDGRRHGQHGSAYGKTAEYLVFLSYQVVVPAKYSRFSAAGAGINSPNTSNLISIAGAIELFVDRDIGSAARRTCRESRPSSDGAL